LLIWQSCYWRMWTASIIFAILLWMVYTSIAFPRAPQDYGFMYGHGFDDLDGHIWKLFYMEPSAVKD